MKKSILRDNAGSATITVIVTMLMVIAFGSALLFGAYTAYRIALTEREDAKSFYMAESAMDDIRSGVQKAASDALARAYTKTLTEYASSSDPTFEPQSAFARYFEQELADPGFANNFYLNGKYATEKLSDYMAFPDGVTCEVFADYNKTSDEGTVDRELTDGVLTALTLQKVCLSCVYDGYEADISADIRINVPSYTGNMSEFALVAGGGIVQSDNKKSMINGSVFSGADITVRTGASLELHGSSYVGDDLVLAGSGSKAVLVGKYVGFGAAEKADNTLNAPGASSAILVNGKSSVLDISGLEQLTLAGISFIDITGISETPGAVTNHSALVPMGQSMSLKSDQLAYLLPAECLTNYATNPCVLRTTGTIDEDGNTTTAVVEPSVKSDAVLWDDKPLSDYIGGGKGGTKVLYKNLDNGNVQIAYVFLVFNTREAANTYFHDYFTKYPERIRQYLDFYLQLSSTSAYVSAAGNTYKMVGGELETEGQRAVSANGCHFEDFVNVEELDALNETLEFSAGGKTAVVTNRKDEDNYSYDINDSNCVLVISGGNVTINSSINGTVLANGVVTINGGAGVTGINAAALPAGLIDAEAGGHKLSDYLKAGYGGEKTALTDAWASEKLVVYENWTKS